MRNKTAENGTRGGASRLSLSNNKKSSLELDEVLAYSSNKQPP